MESYESTMRVGARLYAGTLSALANLGLDGAFIQTGGMCAAIEVRLETGHTLLITDADDTLSWSRDEQVGWGVGLYSPGEDHDGAVAFESTEETSDAALIETIMTLLGQVGK